MVEKIEDGIKGWKCSDWIERALNDSKWFCKTYCPFGRNGTETKFLSCDRDRNNLIKRVQGQKDMICRKCGKEIEQFDCCRCAIDKSWFEHIRCGK